MPQAINGKDLLAFFRRFADRATVDARRNRFQTEHTVSAEKETNSTTTKDGPLNSIADGESTAEFTSIAYREDGADVIALWKQMRKWFRDNELVEFWQVDFGSRRTEDGKEVFDVDYYQGKFTSFELSAPADDLVELSFEFAIDGKGVEDHTDTLTAEQLQAIQSGMYDYETLAATGGATPTTPLTNTLYTPVAKDVNTTVDVVPNAKDAIENSATLPADAVYSWVTEPVVSAPATVQADVKVTYADASSDTVTVNVIVA